MLRMLVCGLAVLTMGSSLLYAHQGIVKTKDGMVYEGNVTETPDTVEVAGVAGQTEPVKINRANVSQIIFPDVVADEVHKILKTIAPTDVASRLKWAKTAIECHAYEAARDALQEAIRIDPNNKEVSDLLVVVNKSLVPVTTRPATQAATTNPTVTAVGPKVPAGAFLAKRMVTPRELNRIRQLECMKLDDTFDLAGNKVLGQFDQDTRKRFLASGPPFTPAEFNKLSPQEQASLVLGNEDLREGVTIKGDPLTVAEFKKSVQRVVTQSCGSCHGPQKGRVFTLFPPSNDAAIYTNFLTLQKYNMYVRGTERSLVDRNQPEGSLLLQFLLVPDIAEIPHPDVAGAKGPFRSKNDPRYQQILHWIQSLNPKFPKYGIDLSDVVTPGKTGK